MSTEQGEGTKQILQEDPWVYGPTDPLPPALATAPALFRAAAEGGLALALIARQKGAPKVEAKRQHDLKAALRTLGFAVKALTSGYTFQDEAAAAKIEAIAGAVAVLERESSALLRVLQAGTER